MTAPLAELASLAALDAAESFDERAGIREYDGGLPRDEAEQAARADVARVPLVAVAADKFAPGWRADRRDVPHAYAVLPLAWALAHVWPTDAHLVVYTATGAGQWQPRLCKDTVADYGEPVVCNVLLADVDNPKHAEWTPATLAVAVEQHRTLPILQSAGWYVTAHGRRIVQPLAAPVPVPAVEGYLRRWLADLEAAGLAVDRACLDWTRHFRLPHVTRDRVPYRSPVVEV